MEKHERHACTEIENNSFLIVNMVTDVACNDDDDVTQHAGHASTKHHPIYDERSHSHVLWEKATLYHQL